MQSGTEGWDYFTVDSATRVSCGMFVNVLDADTGKAVGVNEDMSGFHGIALASNVDLGFVVMEVPNPKASNEEGALKIGAKVHDEVKRRIPNKSALHQP